MDSDKLESVIAALASRNVHLNPPVSIQVVRDIEKKYSIKLPQEYVEFVTKVGNGGVLPDSSGLKQLSQYLYPIDQCNFEKASIPFPYNISWDWGHDDNYDSIKDPERKVQITQNGHFALVSPDDGEGYTWNLIVTGECRGEVWAFSDWKMCRGKSVDFLDWVLDCVVNGFRGDHYIDPENFNRDCDLASRINKIRKKIKRKKLMLRPAVNVEQITKLENTWGIKLPKEYIAFLTQVGNGFVSTDAEFRRSMNPIESCSPEQLHHPFPLKETWMFTTDTHISSTPNNRYNVSIDCDRIWQQIQCGYIILGTETKRLLPIKQSFLLIVNGNRRGEVWMLSYQMATGNGEYIRLADMCFWDWIDLYLNGFSF